MILPLILKCALFFACLHLAAGIDIITNDNFVVLVSPGFNDCLVSYSCAGNDAVNISFDYLKPIQVCASQQRIYLTGLFCEGTAYQIVTNTYTMDYWTYDFINSGLYAFYDNGNFFYSLNGANSMWLYYRNQFTSMVAKQQLPYPYSTNLCPETMTILLNSQYVFSPSSATYMALQSLIFFFLSIRLIRTSKWAHHLNGVLAWLCLARAGFTARAGHGIWSLSDPSCRSGNQITCHNDHGCAGLRIAIRRRLAGVFENNQSCARCDCLCGVVSTREGRVLVRLSFLTDRIGGSAG